MTQESIDAMSDDQKFTVICALVKALSQEYKDRVLLEIVGSNVTGEAQVTVSSNNELVRVDFGRPLAWFCLPKAHALQLGVSLMQHAGATLEQIPRPPDASS